MNRIVIIPVLNPDKKLWDIVQENLKLENQVIVVDDGSEKKYAQFFWELGEQCIVLHHRKNKGKGAAIKTGLRYIKDELWEYSNIGIMDADGQHLSGDLEKLLMKSAAFPGTLILGSRAIDKKMPLPSRIGNLVTRRVFHAATGKQVADTQTGLRAFSADLLEFMLEISGERYEYETKVLLECAKREIPIIEVPIHTIYHDRSNSCSHFRKIRDSVRIYRQLLRFFSVSFSSFLLDYGLFVLLTLLFPKTAGFVAAANILARMLSGAYNYIMNCQMVFHERKTIKTAADYVLLAGVILLLNNLLLQGFVLLLQMPVYPAKILTEGVLFIISWLIQKKIIFKRGRRFTCNAKTWIAAGIDLFAAVFLLAGIYGVNYIMPQKGAAAQDMEQITEKAKLQNRSLKVSAGQTTDSVKEQKLQNLIDENAEGIATTKVLLDTQDWHEKFADKFTQQIISTDTSYTSPNLSVKFTRHSYDTNKLDCTENGQHKKYGSRISYTLADVYVGDITCLQTCFAQNTYGIGYSEKLSEMSARMKSVLGINGDSYSNSRHQDNGTIIRNGVIYRAQPTDMETCVLNWDGTMNIYSPGELDTQQLIDSGAYQSWVFGPSLLDSSGKANRKFQTWPYIRESHPRTAIGYYEPGHYCFLVVDGRQKASRGMFLEEMAKLFEELGCKAAYNLDGGHCSFMTMENQVISRPYKPEHMVEDGLFITEGLQ